MGHNISKTHQYIYWIIVLVLFVVGTGRHFYELDKKSYWLDEFVTVEISQEPTFTELLERRQNDYNPPLYDIMIRPFTFEQPFNEYWPRFPAALGGSLFLIFMFLLGRAVGGPICGLWALALSVASFEVLYFSQEARPYSWVLAMAAWAVLSSYELFGGQEPKSKKQMGLLTLQFAFAAACLLLLHYQGMIFLIFLTTWCLIWAWVRGRLRYLSAGLALVGLGSSIWIPTYIRHAQAPPDHLHGPSSTLLKTINAVLEFGLNGYSLPLGVTTAVVIIFLYRYSRKLKPEVSLSLSLLFGPIAFVHCYYLSHGLDPLTPRHLIVILPVMYLFIAQILSRMRMNSALHAFLALALSLASMYDIVYLRHYYAQTFKNEDARSVALKIMNLHAKHGGKIQFVLKSWGPGVNTYLQYFQSTADIDYFMGCNHEMDAPLGVESEVVAVIQISGCNSPLLLNQFLPNFSQNEVINMADGTRVALLQRMQQ